MPEHWCGMEGRCPLPVNTNDDWRFGRERLLGRSPGPARPVVCLDESPLQLIGEVRESIPAAPGRVERVDYEYRRNGMVNPFVVVDAHWPWRKVTVSEQRTARDYQAAARKRRRVVHCA